MAEASSSTKGSAPATPKVSAPKDGQFVISIVEARGLLTVPDANSQVYCSCQFEKQEAKTKPVTFTTSPSWNEEFTFDTQRSVVEVFFALWEYKLDGNRRFIGKLIIRVNLSMLEGPEPLANWYGLRGRFEGEKASGELHVKLMYTLSKSSVSVEDFESLCVLGRGGYGKVTLVKKKDTNRLYAMKSIHKTKLIETDEVEGTKMEKEVLKKINHPFIVGLKFSFQTEEKLYLVLDYINGGELFYHLKREKRFNEDRARFYTAELVLALEYLHKQGIVYRDLKPENILLDCNGHICLTDFGLCKEGVEEGKLTYTFCGTAEYLAPEILQGKGYNKTVDWWSLGTLLFEMLVGRPPFFSTNTKDMYNKILFEPLSFPAIVTQSSRAVLMAFLDRDPDERLGAGHSDAEEVKSHPFFAALDWSLLMSKDLEPPFKPPVMDPLDTRNFDSTFTSQSVSDSPAGWRLAPSQQSQFAGFSYTNPNELNSPSP